MCWIDIFRPLRPGAKQTRSHLFLYSPYAWEAFTTTYSHSPKKVLFQYHPHPQLERRLMSEDRVRFPGFGESFTGTQYGQAPDEHLQRERDAWKYADLIFCASQFTKRSLLEVGADDQKCQVVPYGIDVAAVTCHDPPSNDFRVIFVGSGGQRKGLHHLLMAWKQASLPKSSSLTVICRVIDSEIERLAAVTPRANHSWGVAIQAESRICRQHTVRDAVAGRRLWTGLS